MTELAQPADRFHPAEDFFDAFPRHLADRVAGMASGPAIESATLGLQGDMGRGVDDLRLARASNCSFDRASLCRARVNRALSFLDSNHCEGCANLEISGPLIGKIFPVRGE